MNGIPGPLEVTVVHADCPQYADGGSCADLDRAIIYLADDDEFTRQHELGHLDDAQRLDDSERAELAPLLGASADIPWDAGTGYEQCAGTGDVCPSERFADAFATCRLGWTPDGRNGRDGVIRGEWADAYGYAPSMRTHRRVCAAIRRFADI